MSGGSRNPPSVDNLTPLGASRLAACDGQRAPLDCGTFQAARRQTQAYLLRGLSVTHTWHAPECAWLCRTVPSGISLLLPLLPTNRQLH
jgi:hypothetical protein